jgi:hypothetical protein
MKIIVPEEDELPYLDSAHPAISDVAQADQITIGDPKTTGWMGRRWEFWQYYKSQGYNVVSDTSCALNGVGDLQNTSALLGPLTNNGGPTMTHLPDMHTPVVDRISAGTNGCGTDVTTDQRGALRPIDGDRVPPLTLHLSGLSFETPLLCALTAIRDLIDHTTKLPVDRTSWALTKVTLLALPAAVEFDAQIVIGRVVLLRGRASPALLPTKFLLRGLMGTAVG